MLAMNRALILPEIVAAILETDRNEQAFIKSCILVNRRFSSEAIRILWARCGTAKEGVTSFQEPPVHALANIAARDHERAKYYASFVRELRFVRRCENWYPHWPMSEAKQHWHDILRGLEFPLLYFFRVDGRTENDPTRYSSRPQGAFYDFRESKRDGIFWHILGSSPNLKSIDLALHVPYDWDDVEEEAVRFIESTPTLSSLRLSRKEEQYTSDDQTLYESWPPAVLKSLAALPALRELQGYSFSFNQEDLELVLPDAFLALENLETICIFGDLDFLPAVFPNLSVLDLKISQQVRGVGTLAGFSRLTSLTVLLPENFVISADDLLALGSGCPHLTTLNLPAVVILKMEEPCPIGEDIDDDTICELSKKLPYLDTLCLGFENRATLTHNSIIHLAVNCPNLGYFHITADVNMSLLIEGLKVLALEAERPLLQAFNFMRLYLPEDSNYKYSNVKQLAKDLLKLAPEIEEFDIYDGSKSDDKLQGKLRELIHERKLRKYAVPDMDWVTD